MIERLVPWAAAIAIFIGVTGYTLVGLNEKSFALAEVSRDVCYARHGISLAGTPAIPEEIRTDCTRPIRDHQADLIWRTLIAAAVGATCALLLVGGVVIVLRARRGGDPDPR